MLKSGRDFGKDANFLKQAAQCIVVAVAENDVTKLRTVAKAIGKE